MTFRFRVLLSLSVVSAISCSSPPTPYKASKGTPAGANGTAAGGPPGSTSTNAGVGLTCFPESTVMGTDGKPIAATGTTAIALASDGAVSIFPRLTHEQWENTVRDLLQLSAIPGDSKNFPNDPVSTFGNDGALLNVSSDQWTAYRNAADRLGAKISLDKAAYTKLIPAGVTDPRAIVSAFLRNAFRRPATTEEINELVADFNNGPKLTGKTDALAAGIDVMITTVLQSPSFLYRVEAGSACGNAYKLTPYEVASRLSYLLWNTMPDEVLSKLADSGQIMDPAVVKAQSKRMLSDARASNLISSVHMKAYGLDQFTVIPQDTKDYPEASKFTTEDLRKESELFVKDVVVTQGKGVTELFTAPYAFASSKTASAYDVALSSTEIKKVDLDASQRAGILSQLGFLSNFSKKGGLTAIVKRGHYVAETVLCSSFKGAPPPPAETDAVKTFKTNREYVTALTSVPGCAGCHDPKVNPPGFALDNYGPAGKWRTAEKNGSMIDSSGTFVFGTNDSIAFNGPIEFVTEMVKRPEFHQCYVQKLLEAFYGRNANVNDGRLIEKLGVASREGMSPENIILTILSDSAIFTRSEK